MRKRAIFFPFLLLVFLIHSVPVLEGRENREWSEKKLGQVIIKADRAARHKKWARAITYGEQMLAGSAVLDRETGPRYIGLLNKLNRYYDKAGRLEEVAPRLEKAYNLSTEHLGPAHKITKQSRILLYKLLVSDQNYHDAIPLVMENIALLNQRENDHYRRLHYLKQLYSLYKLTGQFEKEEQTLLRYLQLEKRVFGSPGKEDNKTVLDLAENYCRQKKAKEFKKLMKKHNLNYTCP